MIKTISYKQKVKFLLIAANTEAGGNGACTDGTEVGVEVKLVQQMMRNMLMN